MDISQFIVQKDTTVLNAAAAIDANGRQIVFVCDRVKLIAAFADSDLRRYILKMGDLTASVFSAAYLKPVRLTVDKQADAKKLLDQNSTLRAIPIVDTEDNLVSIVFPDSTDAQNKAQLNIPVVIMAGGKGTRLAPYTNVLPKPLIPIDDKTITEHIIDRFVNIGCSDFIMIVNHKKELIKAYFKETQCKGTLQFVDEDVFLGTGGGLKLLESIIHSTFFMTNCDILVEADYEDILRHHKKAGAMLTMVCALKKISVPYGTVELDKSGKLSELVEKPEFPILANTGLYIVEPELINIIKHNEAVDITQLIQRLKDSGKTVGVYPVADAGWMDMGQPEEHFKMQQHFAGK